MFLSFSTTVSCFKEVAAVVVVVGGGGDVVAAAALKVSTKIGLRLVPTNRGLKCGLLKKLKLLV